MTFSFDSNIDTARFNAMCRLLYLLNELNIPCNTKNLWHYAQTTQARALIGDGPIGVSVYSSGDPTQ